MPDPQSLLERSLYASFWRGLISEVLIAAALSELPGEGIMKNKPLLPVVAETEEHYQRSLPDADNALKLLEKIHKSRKSRP